MEVRAGPYGYDQIGSISAGKNEILESTLKKAPATFFLLSKIFSVPYPWPISNKRFGTNFSQLLRGTWRLRVASTLK